MIFELKVPSLGESVSNAVIANWLVADGDFVGKDQEVVEIDSDKATVAVSSEQSGKISILIPAGEKVGIGDVIATVDTEQTGNQTSKAKKEQTEEEASVIPEKQSQSTDSEEKAQPLKDVRVSISPLAEKLISENQVDIEELIHDKLIRITKGDVEKFLQKPTKPKQEISREESREEMTTLRKKLSERLVQSKNQTAMLTTFNEIDMSRLIEIRKKYNEEFQKKYGIKLGFMSFFTKAVTLALDEFPQVNASIENSEIVYHHYKDIGIAVSTPKGLMVPVIRNAEAMDLFEIELKINELATKARNKKLSLDEMSGGTFTITNGGVFGSLLSTPIINPPQVAILGMHKIQDRPVGIDGKIELRPMMYVALSYDHRLIDGKESVSFLVKVKELLENPVNLAFGNDPLRSLLGL
ncbi:MAG TPA: 2-oxoglutarate dehydrogenase complex dihydrolipoyllysine-residue succinyltransferase [Bacteroidia bacterium]|nr:2-oxoglutarate dehydrogenase complex dihydrolipoyllysine-residue succinyltransferase [Bacteroidia bacterium]HRS58180.1 2-oxoglutarate dehydrogenase complex dihydrolipoyllysine-residue succinyltransferase [Bacteroidia bacterium]HRU67510.1 2-oxoglutarate dehydrogenase complex dihydrolipoyllysine-residue succinyltransferase [Bacteroidia bacterium]